MFDVSWIELAFVAVLALLVVGPRDLPKLLHAVGLMVSRSRKLYRQVISGVGTLDREVQIASGQRKSETEMWRNYVPESIRNLPEDFLPGSMTAEQHEARQQAFQQARERAMSEQNANAESSPHNTAPAEKP